MISQEYSRCLAIYCSQITIVPSSSLQSSSYLNFFFFLHCSQLCTAWLRWKDNHSLLLKRTWQDLNPAHIPSFATNSIIVTFITILENAQWPHLPPHLTNLASCKPGHEDPTLQPLSLILQGMENLWQVYWRHDGKPKIKSFVTTKCLSASFRLPSFKCGVGDDETMLSYFFPIQALIIPESINISGCWWAHLFINLFVEILYVDEL